MNANIENQNLYLAELKSLVKDKFFMLLLGISVSIVLLSTIYSFVKPKETGQIASGAQTANEESMESGEIAAVPTVYLEGIDSIEGLEEQAVEAPVATGTQTSFFDKVKKSAQDLLKGNNAVSEDEKLAQTMREEQEKQAMLEAKTPKVGGVYVVQEGDNLWMIAEKAYNSGYNYVDLVAANSLAYNGDMIDVGQKITIPQVTPKASTTGGDITTKAATTRSEESISATYTAVEGDCLWTIAGTQYNDPYMWTRIAQLNSLPNPDFIMVGQVLRLK